MRNASQFLIRLVMFSTLTLALAACGDATSETAMEGAGGSTTAGGNTTSSGGTLSTGGVISNGGSMSGGVTSDAGTESNETGASDIPVSFKKQILPLLETNCMRCHGPSRQNGGVRVDSYLEVKSRLTIVTHMLVDGLMPPSGPLPMANRQLFETWVNQGALDN